MSDDTDVGIPAIIHGYCIIPRYGCPQEYAGTLMNWCFLQTGAGYLSVDRTCT